MAVAKKKAVAKKQSQELEQVPDYIKTGGNRGNEGITNEDLQLPRLNVLQALSPQLSKNKPEYIEGSSVGDIFNTLTGQLYPNGVVVTPVTFQKRWFVWKTQDSGGGLQGIYDFDQQKDAEAHAEKDEDYENVLTHEHLGMLEDGTEIIISCAKSKLRKSKKWNSLIRLNGGDRFSRNYLITSVDDQNDQGQEYQNFNIAAAIGRQAYPSQGQYEAAEALYTQVSAGTSYGGDYSDEIVLDGESEEDTY